MEEEEEEEYIVIHSLTVPPTRQGCSRYVSFPSDAIPRVVTRSLMDAFSIAGGTDDGDDDDNDDDHEERRKGRNQETRQSRRQ